MANRMRATKLDRAIFVATVSLSAAAMLASGLVAGRGTRRVVVEVDGEAYGVYPLDRIEISPDGVRVTESDCPDRREVAEGEISKRGQSLICLPHRLIVRIAQEGGETDASTY